MSREKNVGSLGWIGGVDDKAEKDLSQLKPQALKRPGSLLLDVWRGSK